jgi:hypothetical protein
MDPAVRAMKEDVSEPEAGEMKFYHPTEAKQPLSRTIIYGYVM